MNRRDPLVAATAALSHFVPAEGPPITAEQWLAAARQTSAGKIGVGRELMEL